MTQNEQDRIDAARYRKLRHYMSMNQESTWRYVERVAAVGCYTTFDDFDGYLDAAPEVTESWETIQHFCDHES
jgi:hypothetical protein